MSRRRCLSHMRDKVLAKTGARCTYCGVPNGCRGEAVPQGGYLWIGASLEIDHIIPLAKGGTNHLANLTPACRQCNNAKRDRPLGQWLSERRA